ncbi:hypothetical protein D7V90_07965 [bacterium 1xD42-87]|nr:hypothetical protein D7V90_07965 [bacterium 1xD42-87]
MCNFKSGIILKNKVVLAPEGNESHSDLLESLGIEDNHINATKTFVRAELIPKNNDKMTDVKEWRYKVDQDIVPDWYEKDPERYEKEFRDAVEKYMEDWRKKFKYICGYYWTSVQDGDRTYYFMNSILKKSEFGKTNNYAESYVRKELVNSELAESLKKEFGDKLLPISLDLTSMDGFKDYDMVEGDILAITNIQLLMKFGESIPLIDNWYWLATPNQTPKRGDARCVQFVNSCGYVCYNVCGYDGGVRPFFILKS